MSIKKQTAPAWQRTAIAVAIAATYSGAAYSAGVSISTGGDSNNCEATISGSSGPSYCYVSEGTVRITSTGEQEGIVIGGTGVRLSNSGLLTGDYPLYVQGGATGAVIDNKAGGRILAESASVGVYFDGDLDGSLTNSGEISASNSGEDAYAIWANQISGSLLNNAGGVIEAVAAGGSGSYSYGGLAVGVGTGQLSGDLTNKGTIRASSASSDSYYGGEDQAIGLWTVNTGSDASLLNTGSIISSAGSSNSLRAAAVGLLGGSFYSDVTNVYGGSVDGAIVNKGTISASVTGGRQSADAVGALFEVFGEDASFDNQGKITAKATRAHQDGYYGGASALGFVADALLSGAAINNSGTISAETWASASAGWAAGLYVDYVAGAYSGSTSGSGGGSVSFPAASITNSGTISASLHAASGSARAVGIDELDGEFTNAATGKILASVEIDSSGPGSNASASGLRINSLEGKLVNNGLISASATTSLPDVWAGASGLSISSIGEDSGNVNLRLLSVPEATAVVNAGTISAYVSASGGVAYGGNIGDIYTGFTNTSAGKITAEIQLASFDGEDGASGIAYGLSVDELNGTLTNNGLISASAKGDANSWAGASGVYIGTVGGSYSSSSSGGGSGGYYPGSFVNNGTISSSVVSGYGEDAGVRVYSLNTELRNSVTGVISASIEAEDGYAVGVAVQNLNGTMTNDGSISASVNVQDEGTAQGVYVSTLNGQLINNGSIVATAGGAVDSWAVASGVKIDTLNGSFDNYGSVSASGGEDGEAYSVFVNGGSGWVTNHAGADLTGSLYVGEDVFLYNEGKVSIPHNGWGYANDYFQYGPEAVLEIGVLNTNNYGALGGGTITLGEDSVLGVNVRSGEEGFALQTGDVLTDVVTADDLYTEMDNGSGGVSLSNSGYGGSLVLNVVDNSSLFGFTAVRDGNTIDLNVERDVSAAQIARETGLGSGAGAGELIDELLDGEGDSSLDPIAGAFGRYGSSREVSNALQRMLPTLRGNAGRAISGGMHGLNRVIQGRQQSARGLNAGDQFAGDNTVWAMPVVAISNQENRGGVAGYEAETMGLVIGMDAAINSTSRGGVALARLRTDAEGNNSASATSLDVDSNQFVLYASHDLSENSELNFQGDIGYNKSSGSRLTVLDNTAKYKNKGWSSHFGVGYSRTYDVNPGTNFVATVRSDYATVSEKAYTETGAGIENLSVAKNTTRELITAVDGKVLYALTPSTKLSANLGLGWDALADADSMGVSFLGVTAPSWKARGTLPAEMVVRAGLGATVVKTNAMEITARYDAEARQDFMQQAVSVKFRMPF